MVRTAYGLLGLSVLAAVGGAYVGSTTPAIISFFTQWYGWIAALVLLNAVPYIALACRHNPVLGTGALILDGFIAGIVLGPAIAVAVLLSSGGNQGLADNIVFQAGIITGVIFLAITAFVIISGKKFNAPAGLMFGIFISIIGAIALNFIFPFGSIFGLIISVAIGLFGVAILVYGTSDLLYDESVDSPIIGALMLFAGIFNVFQAVLHILLMFASDGD